MAKAETSESPGKLRITLEMLEAGEVAYFKWEESSDPSARRLVAQIYRAMRAVEVCDLGTQSMRPHKQAPAICDRSGN